MISGVVMAIASHKGRNGKFCVTVGPVARTAGILTQSVKGAGWLLGRFRLYA